MAAACHEATAGPDEDRSVFDAKLRDGARGPDGIDERYIVPALVRGLAILRSFSKDRPRLGLSEIASVLGVTRSSAYRLVYTLDHVGLLSYDPQARTYSLGSQILSLGYGYLMSRDVVAVAAPHLDRLRDVTSWSAHLGERDGREVVYVARAATRRSTASSVQVGSRLPAHATSLGRVLLSALSDADIATLYANTSLERFGNDTVASVGELRRQARADADRGYVVQVSGFELGIASVAAPIFDVGRRIIASVNVSVILAMTDEGDIDPVLREHVLQAAAAISHDLGDQAARCRAPVRNGSAPR